MQGIVFSINLKQKIKSNKNLNIKYFFNNRINKYNIKNYSYALKKSDYIILEHIVIQEVDDVLNYLISIGLKIIILITNDDCKKTYEKYRHILVCNVLNDNFNYLIKEYLNNKIEPQKKEFLSELKNHKNLIIGISLDHKTGLTNYLFNLSNCLKDINNVIYLEKESSLIDYEYLFELNNKQIKYKKFSIIEDVKEKINDEVVILDYGVVLNQEDLLNLLMYKNVLVFTKKDKNLNKSNKYISMLNLVKNSNALIINYEEIKDRYFNLKKNKKVKKHIYNNLNI